MVIMSSEVIINREFVLIICYGCVVKLLCYLENYV